MGNALLPANFLLIVGDNLPASSLWQGWWDQINTTVFAIYMLGEIRCDWNWSSEGMLVFAAWPNLLNILEAEFAWRGFSVQVNHDVEVHTVNGDGENVRYFIYITSVNLLKAGCLLWLQSLYISEKRLWMCLHVCRFTITRFKNRKYYDRKMILELFKNKNYIFASR